LLERRLRVRPVRHPGKLQGIDELLAPVRKRSFDNLLDAAEVIGQAGAPERDECRVDVGPGPEDGA
jgi:hypothetical protein